MSGGVRDSILSIAPVAPGEVLVVDDDADVRKRLLSQMTTLALAVVQAEAGERALIVARERSLTLDCILLDLAMPTMDGWAVLAALRADAETAQIPVIVLTDGQPSEVEVLRIIEAGAVDFLNKPLVMPMVLAKVRATCDRAKAQREMRNKLRFALENAAHDPLTGLFNRRYFERRLREETAHARRHTKPFSVVMIDLDHFKLVNDTYGHEDGDRVLQHLTEIMNASLRDDDIACRYGGEEFVLLLRSTTRETARVVSNRLRNALTGRPIGLGPDRQMRHVTFSAGVAAADERNEFNADDIVGRADAALYRAKRAGRNRTEME